MKVAPVGRGSGRQVRVLADRAGRVGRTLCVFVGRPHNSTHDEKRGGGAGPGRRPRRPAGPRAPRPRPSAAASPACSGPSGCGKSTLMRSLVGVQQPRRRQRAGLRRGGRQPAAARPRRLRHPGRQRVRRPHGRREPRVLRPRARGRTATEVDRGGRGGRPRPPPRPGRRPALRAASAAASSLAVALLGSPDLLVLDEPTVGLDPVLRRDLWALFHRLAEAGAAVFVSSHVMDEADRCDRLLLMREGRIIADGAPEEIRQKTGADDIESAFLAHRRGGRGMTARSARASPWRSPRRVLTQLRRDHRTLAHAAAAALPADLAALVDVRRLRRRPSSTGSGRRCWRSSRCIVMFLVTSVTTLRERSSGTLERLLAMPMGKLDFLVGYALAFGLVAAVQSVLAVGDQRRAARPRRARPGLAADDRRGRRRRARHRARAVRVGVRADRVPGGAVHAGAADPAAAAVRAVRAARRCCRPPWSGSATCCRCPTPSTRCSTSPPAPTPGPCGRTRHRRTLRAGRAGPGRGHPAPTHLLSVDPPRPPGPPALASRP